MKVFLFLPILFIFFNNKNYVYYYFEKKIWLVQSNVFGKNFFCVTQKPIKYSPVLLDQQYNNRIEELLKKENINKNCLTLKYLNTMSQESLLSDIKVGKIKPLVVVYYLLNSNLYSLKRESITEKLLNDNDFENIRQNVLTHLAFNDQDHGMNDSDSKFNNNVSEDQCEKVNNLLRETDLKNMLPDNQDFIKNVFMSLNYIEDDLFINIINYCIDKELKLFFIEWRQYDSFKRLILLPVFFDYGFSNKKKDFNDIFFDLIDDFLLIILTVWCEYHIASVKSWSFVLTILYYKSLLFETVVKKFWQSRNEIQKREFRISFNTFCDDSIKEQEKDYSCCILEGIKKILNNDENHEKNALEDENKDDQGKKK